MTFFRKESFLKAFFRAWLSRNYIKKFVMLMALSAKKVADPGLKHRQNNFLYGLKQGCQTQIRSGAALGKFIATRARNFLF